MTAKQVLLVRLDVFAKQRMTGALGDANVDDITRFNLAIRRLGEDRSFKLVASPREVVFVAPALAVNQNPTSAPDLLFENLGADDFLQLDNLAQALAFKLLADVVGHIAGGVGIAALGIFEKIRKIKSRRLQQLHRM